MRDPEAMPDRLRILVVEDEPDTLSAMEQLLTVWGHEVHVVSDGPSALEIASQVEPEVVLLDIGLPGMDGWEVAKRLRQQEATRDAKLIALTGYGRDIDRARSRSEGFERHLLKPLNVAELRRCLAQVMRDG